MDELSNRAALWLKSQHIQVPQDWLLACLDWINEDNQGAVLNQHDLNTEVLQQWLHSDLHDIESLCFPPGLETVEKFVLEGQFSVQVDSIIDIGSPVYSQLQKIKGAENSNEMVSAAQPTQPFWEQKPTRMLMMQLTDGTQTVKGMEYNSIQCLNTALPPGTKILIKGQILCRLGTLMLKADNVQVLGGEVDTLVEENSQLNILSRALRRVGGEPDNMPAMQRNQHPRVSNTGPTTQRPQNINNNNGSNSTSNRDIIDRNETVPKTKPTGKPNSRACSSSSSLSNTGGHPGTLNSHLTTPGASATDNSNSTDTEMCAQMNAVDFDDHWGTDDDEMDYVAAITEDNNNTNYLMPSDDTRQQLQVKSQSEIDEEDFEDEIAYNVIKKDIYKPKQTSTLCTSKEENNLYNSLNDIPCNVIDNASLERNISKANTLVGSKSTITSNQNDSLWGDESDIMIIDDSMCIASGQRNIPSCPSYADVMNYKEDIKRMRLDASSAKSKVKKSSELVPENLENTCSICLEILNIPKILECQHSFCLVCLQQYTQQNNYRSALPCPMCRKECAIPLGVQCLEDNLSIGPSKTMVENVGETSLEVSRIQDLKTSPLPGSYKVEASVVTVTGKLKSYGGSQWGLPCMIRDTTGLIEVELGDNILSEMLGLTAEEAVEKRNDRVMKRVLKRGIRRCEDYLAKMSGTMYLEYNHSQSMPIITKHTSFDSKMW